MDVAQRITIQGTVQGVGFRPFVYRAALACDIRGTVANRASGVEIRAQGQAASLARFQQILQSDPPPLAEIRQVKTETCETADFTDFAIVASQGGDVPAVDIARDTTVCAACLRELNDPDDRRYRHPFINCTHCGPRYTIIGGLPYDRPQTTMGTFPMCAACQTEYEDPLNRRFHAQPVCCPECGPQLFYCDAQGQQQAVDDPLAYAMQQLEDGQIVAIKGLGGFHLACRADDAAAVARLRERKHREEKPFALMVKDLKAARSICRISDQEARLLEGIERPIVLLEKNEQSNVLSDIAPGMTTLGLMLPYTPLHHLLFEQSAYPSLVMTSANRSAEPLCSANEEAIEKLVGIADGFLMHNRAIQISVDDSIVRELDGEPVLLRRARGFVPAPLPVPFSVDGLVALGGIMKSTVAIGRKNTVYVSQYLGTADSVETLEHADAVRKHLLEVLSVQPKLVVMDSHPGGLQDGLVDASMAQMSLQHHHAHAAACMAENGINEPTVCVVFDGLGLGADGHIWGGELFVADFRVAKRVAHLAYSPMPGGDAATRYPGRMALGILGATAAEQMDWMPEEEKAAVLGMMARQVNCPQTSSMGRLFDAMAALLDLCREQTFEGQSAMRLEGLAHTVKEQMGYTVPLEEQDGIWQWNGAALLRAALEDLQSGTSKGTVAARFHEAVARMTVEAVERVMEQHLLTSRKVCLSGGCFQNAFLLKRVKEGLNEKGMEAVLHRRLSPGDECIAFGQVVVAAHQKEDACV